MKEWAAVLLRTWAPYSDPSDFQTMDNNIKYKSSLILVKTPPGGHILGWQNFSKSWPCSDRKISRAAWHEPSLRAGGHWGCSAVPGNSWGHLDSSPHHPHCHFLLKSNQIIKSLQFALPLPLFQGCFGFSSGSNRAGLCLAAGGSGFGVCSSLPAWARPDGCRDQ